jgi:Fe-S-cluster containining protein
MKLLVLEDERFSCQSCTSCCRNWYVDLVPGEPEKITGLQWPAGDPLSGIEPIVRHGGMNMLARSSNGACIFLNESNGYCRIQEQFGVDAKPLGCRIFPFQISPTFEGQASVLGRMDCPTVRKNLGALHSDSLTDLRNYAERIGPMRGFDERECRGLNRNQMEAVCQFIGTMIGGFATDSQRAIFILYLCDLLAATKPSEIGRTELAQIFPRLKKIVEGVTASSWRRPGFLTRLVFRAQLGLYLRRDEDALTGRVGRIGRPLALTKVIFGFGNFQKLGLANKPGSVSKAKLFRPMPQPHDPAVFALFWRVVRNRLDSFQFMGVANGGRDFLEGLRSLALLYPLVLATAKYSAMSQNSSQINVEDVDYAITAIEHSYGRSPVLNLPVMRGNERFLQDLDRFAKLTQNM